MYQLHWLRSRGFRVVVLEAGDDVGGTWYWNRYPGARCDIESLAYSYSFDDALQQEWHWPHRFAYQPDILRYVRHVADRLDLRRDIRFGVTVTAAQFDDRAGTWTLTAEDGSQVVACFCVMATGCLSVPKGDEFPGEREFRGPSWHTSRWPEDGVDFTGMTVAVIGTGSSAIQAIPVIAAQARHVTVFQRTPNFSVPAHNGPVAADVAADWAANRAAYRAQAREAGFGIRAVAMDDTPALEATPEQRKAAFEARWTYGGFALLGAYNDLVLDRAANQTAVDFMADKIRGIVNDPATAEKLIPRTYPIGAKRLCVDTGYYATFNRPNVSLVDIADEPIEGITPAGVKTSAGEYAVDAIVYAIGFDAMTGALSKIDIRGRGGRRLTEAWSAGPRTYLGLMTAGFPNLFLVTGPGSPSVLCNMAVAIEQHVEWISDCIAWMGERQMGAIEASEPAQDAWVDHVNEVANGTVYPQADSWYMGANVPGKPRVFMPYIGGFPVYRDKCAEVAANGYEGFHVG
ncbi:MAG: NAD(P)/FAD-dependent oxidoreductase, partial [Phenylobacterium sp.]|nr:NAD(P)/FAD-dependent oxidoreductase [Phenylobacterium sp.]